MKAAIETTAAITHGLTAGRQGSAAEGGALPFPLELSVCESIEPRCPHTKITAEIHRRQPLG